MQPETSQSWKDEIESLLAESLEGSLIESRRIELNELLRRNSEALKYVCDVLSDEAFLHHEVSALATGELLGLRSFLPGSESTELDIIRLRKLWVCGAGLVASLILAFYLGHWFQPRTPTADVSSSPKISENEPAIALSVLAFDAELNGHRVYSSHGGSGGDEDGVGRALEFAAGSYDLSRGSLELRFRNGVQALLEGPSQFTIQSDMELVMHSGKIRTRVPDQAKGFTVVTPELDVVDLGTEFGIAVDQEEQTELHVFSGLVELHEKGNKEPRLVKEGFAGTWRDGKTTVSTKFPDSSSFKSPQGVAYERWFRHRNELLSDPHILIYYGFDHDVTGGDKVINQVSAGVYDGMLNQRSSVSGRWKNKAALQFDHPESFVEVNLGLELERLTVCAWVKLERFDSSMVALFNSVGLSPSNFHWQIRENGAMRVSSENVFYSNTTVKSVGLGEWTHVAVTYDAGERKVRAYANGKVVSTTLAQGIGPVKIGRAQIGRWENPSYWPYERDLKGRVDEFVVFRRKLESREIREIYVKGSPASW